MILVTLQFGISYSRYLMVNLVIEIWHQEYIDCAKLKYIIHFKKRKPFLLKELNNRRYYMY